MSEEIDSLMRMFILVPGCPRCTQSVRSWRCGTEACLGLVTSTSESCNVSEFMRQCVSCQTQDIMCCLSEAPLGSINCEEYRHQEKVGNIEQCTLFNLCGHPTNVGVELWILHHILSPSHWPLNKLLYNEKYIIMSQLPGIMSDTK